MPWKKFIPRKRKKKAPPKRVVDNLEFGLEATYGHPDDRYHACAWRDIGQIDGEYLLCFYKGEMPAHKTEQFDTVEELVKAMREVQPDLRKWTLNRP